MPIDDKGRIDDGLLQYTAEKVPSHDADISDE